MRGPNNVDTDIFLQIENAPILKRRGRQEERSEEVPDQVFTGRQNSVSEELDPAAGSFGGLVVDNSVEQLTVEIGELRHEIRTLIEMLAEQRKPRQDQAPLVLRPLRGRKFP